MLPTRIHLVDRSNRLAGEWKLAFAGYPEITVAAGDYLEHTADAIVSPANSFGIMDGGIDLALREALGYTIERKVQAAITERHRGEMPVGCAEIIETGDARWKYLITAPTMRVPESVAYTLNAFHAFRAVLAAVEAFNKQRGRVDIDSLVCCGLATGVGGMAASRCARQMAIAYEIFRAPPAIPSFAAIHQLHRALHLT